ncbi:uncharacterized protein LOC144155115 [Haemaphysalis longicornis]
MSRSVLRTAVAYRVSAIAPQTAQRGPLAASYSAERFVGSRPLQPLLPPPPPPVVHSEDASSYMSFPVGDVLALAAANEEVLQKLRRINASSTTFVDDVPSDGAAAYDGTPLTGLAAGLGKEDEEEEEMIASRKEAILLIGMHIVPNVIGLARFSYGFHRTGAWIPGLVFDVSLGIECLINIIASSLIISVLWRSDKATANPAQPATVTRALRLFVAWSTVSLLVCCGFNLGGLKYPPKWYTNEDADKLSLNVKLKFVVIWAPLVIFISLWKLYYTTRLYDFYKLYRATEGRAFDGEGALHEASRGTLPVSPTPAERANAASDAAAPGKQMGAGSVRETPDTGGGLTPAPETPTKTPGASSRRPSLDSSTRQTPTPATPTGPRKTRSRPASVDPSRKSTPVPETPTKQRKTRSRRPSLDPSGRPTPAASGTPSSAAPSVDSVVRRNPAPEVPDTPRGTRRRRGSRDSASRNAPAS